VKWLIQNFWRSVPHRKFVHRGTTRCHRCGYHYSGLHKESKCEH